MQIRAFTRLIFFCVKLPLLELKRDKRDNANYTCINKVTRKGKTGILCEILIAEAKKVLLSIILKRKNLINIYFPHT